MRGVYHKVLCVAIGTRGGVVISTVSVCSDTPELVTSLKRCVIPSSTPDFSDGSSNVIRVSPSETSILTAAFLYFFFSSYQEPLASLIPKSREKKRPYQSPSYGISSVTLFPSRTFIINFHRASLVLLHDKETMRVIAIMLQKNSYTHYTLIKIMNKYEKHTLNYKNPDL